MTAYFLFFRCIFFSHLFHILSSLSTTKNYTLVFLVLVNWPSLPLIYPLLFLTQPLHPPFPIPYFLSLLSSISFLRPFYPFLSLFHSVMFFLTNPSLIQFPFPYIILTFPHFLPSLSIFPFSPFFHYCLSFNQFLYHSLFIPFFYL